MSAVLDIVEQGGYFAVVGFELVHDRTQIRGGLAHGREEQDVLEPVMTVHESAVAKAIGPQLKQWSPCSQGLDLGPDLARSRAVLHVLGQLAACSQVRPDQVVHPLELFEQNVASLVDAGHRPVASLGTD